MACAGPAQVCLPVYFNEPLSALQKMAEELEYSELLDKVRFQSNARCHTTKSPPQHVRQPDVVCHLAGDCP